MSFYRPEPEDDGPDSLEILMCVAQVFACAGIAMAAVTYTFRSFFG